MKWAEASPAILLVEDKIAEFVLSPASRAESIHIPISFLGLRPRLYAGACFPQATKVQADISKWSVTQKKNAAM